MNNTILLVEDNPDDQFLIQRALNKRLLNKVNLVGNWSKLVEKMADSHSSNLNKVDLSYTHIPSVGEYAELAVSIELVENKEEAINYLKGKKIEGNRQHYPLPDLILIGVMKAASWRKRGQKIGHSSLQVPL